MRLLGSFFHVAMNGMAASEKIFRLLDTPEPPRADRPAPRSGTLALEGVDFGYAADRPVLQGVDLTFPRGSFTALVGASGCGKSTVASLLTGRRTPDAGRVTLDGVQLAELSQESLARTVTYLSHNAYLFKGTVRDNLRMARPDAGTRPCGPCWRRCAWRTSCAASRGWTPPWPRGLQPVGRAVPAAGAGPGAAPRQPGVPL